MKIRNTTIDELSAYRVLFICACVLSLIAGIFAIENSSALMKLDSSLSVGEYQDKAEVIKASNDTQCFYGSLDQRKYDFEGQKETSLSCLQYSRDLNAYYLDVGHKMESPDITLDYEFSDVTAVMEYCATPEAKEKTEKKIAIGNLGVTSVTCKEDAKKGQYAVLASAE